MIDKSPVVVEPGLACGGKEAGMSVIGERRGEERRYDYNDPASPVQPRTP